MQNKEKTQDVQDKKSFVYSFARFLARIATYTVFPVTFHGTEHLTLNAPYIIIANHLHFMDPVVIAVKVNKVQIRYLGKKELAQSKFTKWLMARLHMIVVDRNNSDIAAMRACMSALKKGHVLGIFPEGTRHNERIMGKVESGASFIAMRAKVPIIPVLIDRKISLFKRTHVYFGAPLDTEKLYQEGSNNQTVEKLTEMMKQGILSLNQNPS